jgi:hypothetical protein
MPDPSHWLPKWRERFEERAAILEFDANLDRVTAERRALAMTQREMFDLPMEREGTEEFEKWKASLK